MARQSNSAAPAATDAGRNVVAQFEAMAVAAEPRFSQLAVAAARGIDYHRESNFALAKIRESEFLQKCSPQSFQDAFENLAATGLSLNPNLGQAAIVPRWNSKGGGYQCTVMPMYRGFIALATGGGVVQNVWGAVVIEGDDIKLTRGSHPKLEHTTPIGKKGQGRVPTAANVLGAYVIAEIKGSAYQHITWMDIDEILAVAERSETYNPKPRTKNGQTYTPKPSGPWVSDFGQMCVKTVFRRAYKTWPGMDRPEYAALGEAVRLDTEAEIMEQRGRDEEPGNQTLVISEAQFKELRDLAKNSNCPEDTICKAYAVATLEALPADKFAEVRARIEKFGKMSGGSK
jgi:phage RecT family recombinase